MSHECIQHLTKYGSLATLVKTSSSTYPEHKASYPEHKASRGEEHAFDQTNKVPKEP